MATRLAIEHARAQEDKRHNIVSENLGAGTLAANAVNAGANAVKSIVGAIGSMVTAVAAMNPDFYRENDNAIEVAAQKSYYNKKGQPIGDTLLVDSGIVTLDIIPTIGTEPAGTYNTPFQAMFQKTFAEIRSKNSGATTYDYVDLGQATLGLDSMRMIFEEVWRALDLSHYCETHNSYTIRSLVKALGFDVNYMNTNRTAIISILNKFAIDMSPVILPGNLNYFKRHANMCGIVLIDNPGFKRNYYAYKPRGYFIYDELNSSLTFSTDTAYRNDVTKLSQLLESLANRYLFSEAISVMSGDVQRAIINGALSPDSVFTFPTTTLEFEDYYHKDLFCMNEMDLSSFRNATIFKFDSNSAATNYSIKQYYNATSGTFFIYQGELDSNNKPKGVMVKNPCNADGPTQGSKIFPLVMRSDYDTPSTDSIIEDTRLLVPYYNMDSWESASAKPFIPIGTHTSEICVGMSVWTYSTKQRWLSDDVQEFFVDCTYALELATPDITMKIFNNIPYLPVVYSYYGDGAEFTQYFAEYYNAVTVDPEWLRELNQLAMRSLLYFNPKGSASENPSKRVDNNIHNTINNNDKSDRGAKTDKGNKGKNKKKGKKGKKDSKKESNSEKDKKDKPAE